MNTVTLENEKAALAQAADSEENISNLQPKISKLANFPESHSYGNSNKITLYDLEQKCLAEMAANELPFDGKLITDGKLRRYSCDRKKNKPDEWYVAFDGTSKRGNPYLNVVYGTWSDGGQKFHFNSFKKDQTLSKEERTLIIKEWEKKKREAEADQAKEINQRIEKAILEWDNGSDIANGAKDYLDRKKVGIHGVRFSSRKFNDGTEEKHVFNNYDTVLIPLRSIDGNLCAVQHIRPDGAKRITGSKKGSFHLIGKIDNDSIIQIAEGYSTGASIYEVTRNPTIIAVDCGNILSVLESLRKKYLNNKIIIFGDDDVETIDKRTGELCNPGRTKAEAAAKIHRCQTAFPKFPKECFLNGKHPTDWNDLHVHFGVEAVKQQLSEIIEVRNANQGSAVLGNEYQIDTQQIVEEFNETFSIVETSQFGIMEKCRDKILIHKKKDILDRFQNKQVIIGYKDDDEQKPIYKTKAAIWLDAQDRSTFYSIDFLPEKPPGEFTENGKRIYNSWTGFTVEPNKGRCDLFKEHILDVICSSDEALFSYLWKMLSNWVQKPWERTCSPVLRGAQGTGKGAFTETIGKIFGPSYFLTNEHEQVFGRFNAAIMGKVLIHLDEALFGGDRRLIGRVKGLITGPQYPIEMKNRDPIPMNNPRKVIISSNESFAIPVDADDRRFLFLDVSSHRAGDAEYFKRLFKEIESGGLEALLYELMQTDLIGFNPTTLPEGTQKYGFDNKIASANSLVQYLHRALEDGTFFLSVASGNWNNEIRTDLFQEEYLKFCEQRRLRPIVDAQVGKELQYFLGNAGFSKTRKRYDGDQKYSYIIPDLTKCREAFAAIFKSPLSTIFDTY